MSEAEKQLLVLIGKYHAGYLGWDEMKERILERWDVTAKPAIGDEALGRLVRKALRSAWYDDVATSMSVGADVREALEAANLTIVRRDEVRR